MLQVLIALDVFPLRSGDTDTSIEILTSFDQLTLASLGAENEPLEERREEEDAEQKDVTKRALPPSLLSSSNASATTCTAKKSPPSKSEEGTGTLFSSSINASALPSSSQCISPPKREAAASSSPKKREKKESFFCDFKSIPKFPKISSTKSDFDLPPSIFAAAAAIVDAEASSAHSPLSSTASGGVSKSSFVDMTASVGRTPAPGSPRRLLNGDVQKNRRNHHHSNHADAKSSDEYDFISSPER